MITAIAATGFILFQNVKPVRIDNQLRQIFDSSSIDDPSRHTQSTRSPSDEKWTFEIKFDGYRCIAVKRRVRSGGQSPWLIRPSTVSLLTIMIFLTLICLLSTSTTALPRPGISTPSTIGVPPSTSLATATMA